MVGKDEIFQDRDGVEAASTLVKIEKVTDKLTSLKGHSGFLQISHWETAISQQLESNSAGTLITSGGLKADYIRLYILAGVYIGDILTLIGEGKAVTKVTIREVALISGKSPQTREEYVFHDCHIAKWEKPKEGKCHIIYIRYNKLVPNLTGFKPSGGKSGKGSSNINLSAAIVG